MWAHDRDRRSDRRAFLAAAAGTLLGLAWASREDLVRLGGDARAAAGAGAPTLESLRVELGGGRSLAGAGRAGAPARFDLVGLHWRGPGRVWLRTRGLDGGWSGWTAPSDAHGPDPDTDEARRAAGVRAGEPCWTGGADAIEYRAEGRVEDVVAHFVRSPARPLRPGRRLAAAAAPLVLSRSGWGADESIVRSGPAYARRLTLAIVHHTAGRRPATPEESAAVVRAIQAYHVRANGWNDIGYNFLVDPFGQIFEGRAGGVDQNVIGAHALGFNTGSVGVALLGNFQRQQPGDVERQALVELLAWRLDVAHLDPLAPALSSGGLEPLPSVVGHADVNATACPGRHLRPLLPDVASAAAALGLPKLYEPTVEGAPGGPVRFLARLSTPLPWTVTVTDPAGTTVAGGSGRGEAVDWTWQAAAAGPGPYGWRIEAGPGVRPAVGELGAAPPAPRPPKPARPRGLPRRIPRWARELHAWHLLRPRARGPRPRAPRRLPGWYWRWRRWRLAVERWKAAG